AFNGGSALAAGNSAAIVMVTTFVATCAATLAWIGVEKLKDGHVTGVGAASGAITGLVAITPACGAVTPIGAIFVGAIAGAICVYAVGFKEKLGYDDSLDVVGVHLVGGVVGTLLIGFFASEGMPNATNGLFYGGGFDQLWKQAIAAGAVMAYSFAVAFAIAFALKKTIGIRISPEEEEKGIDSTFHRDSAYELEFA
nr:ammonia channel protein [Streptomyces sp. DSM 41633]